MTRKVLLRQVTGRVLYFFPFQLVVLHLKKNHVMLFLWLLLFGYITGSVGRKYGIPSILLYPEYFGQANILSFLMLGFSLGGFITAFNLFTYIFHAYRFPFVATWARPFLKFNINNAIIPVAFVFTYLWRSAKLQMDKELIPPGDTTLHLLGFLLGIGLFLLIALLYFTRTNIDIVKVAGTDADAFRPEPLLEDIIPAAPPRSEGYRNNQQRKATRWLRRQQTTRKWRVDTYLTWPPQIMLTRGIKHYDPELLRAVLWQNHVNGSIFQVAVAVSFIALGIFSNTAFFAIPAGSSIILLFSILLMLFSAASSWLKGWMITLLLAGTVLLNMLSHGTQDFLYDTQAYGLDYRAPPAVYNREVIHEAATDTAAARRDAMAQEAVLQQWLRHNQALPHGDEKPPLVIINTSGGGSRAMLWTFRCLQVADSLLGGQLMERTALLTGSSGGLIGATYYRQLAWGAKNGGAMDPGDPHHLDRMAADILNPVMFSLVTNDMFIRYRKVHDGDRSYTMDRGYTFESRLNGLTDGLLNIRLKDMAEAERRAETPLLVITPTILNDGRRLLISAQPVAYLSNIRPQGPVHATVEPESIEFQALFKDQDAANLKLSSALRMSATFPYITPVVTLPSEPKMRVMDAGVRDNYGYRTTLAYLHTYRHWLAEHVGRVVIIQMRDKQQQLKVRSVGQSLLGRLFQPVGSVYGNFIRAQDQDFDFALKAADAWMPVPLDVINLQLWLDKDAQVSLSWHLTALEKRLVLSMINTPSNQRSLGQLRQLVLGETALSSTQGHGTPAAPAAGPLPRP
ncbi:MAG: patatin-like phospholipase family protein [Flavobacteriales bacterium]|nr:patatin-like phospholipase family protein [Flavobacteriales bacterium]MBP9079900.1 patatin-like phospholipase family protein [Flavobacteriales bacterium]